MSWPASNDPPSYTPPEIRHVDSAGETSTATAGTPLTSISGGSSSPVTQDGQRTSPPQQTSATSSQPDTQRPDQRERASIVSACVQCRSKHLKCDGLCPCTRCATNNLDCIYVKSRRGYKGPRKNGATPATAPTTNGFTNNSNCVLVNPNASVPNGIGNPIPIDYEMQAVPRVHVDRRPPALDIGQEIATVEPRYNGGMTLRERCLEAFFYHFYPAHPFILPRQKFFYVLDERQQPLGKYPSTFKPLFS